MTELFARGGTCEMTYDIVDMTVDVSLEEVTVYIGCSDNAALLRMAEAAEGLAKDLREELKQRQIDRGDG